MNKNDSGNWNRNDNGNKSGNGNRIGEGLMMVITMYIDEADHGEDKGT